MCWGNHHVWTWGATTASDSMPLSLRCACGRYTRQGANDAQAALAAAEQRADRAEADVAMLRNALLPFAHHSLPGYWTESDNRMRIRVTEGQLCRAWMALNNPHWRDEYAQPAALRGETS